jgi:hypothetical protein
VGYSDVVAFTEAQGQLRLQMRVDRDKRFVYPCLWEEKNYKANDSAKGIIEYWANQEQDGFIESVKILIRNKAHDVVWDSSINSKPGGDAISLPATTGPRKNQEQWKDSGFRTRTNTGTDANTKANYVDLGKLFKFIDPDSGPFEAVLVIKSKTEGEKLSRPVPFEARPRKVYWASSDLDAVRRGNAKASMWNTYGFSSGGQEDAGTSGSSDLPKLWLAGGPKFADALECLTPRGVLYAAGHGSRGQCDIDGTWCPGFKGLGEGSGQGTGEAMSALPYDLSTRMQVHCATVFLLSCYSGLPSSNPRSGATALSVVQSFANSLAGTAGGGGKVFGYTTGIYLYPGGFSDQKICDTGFDTDLDGEDYTNAITAALANIWAQAAAMNPTPPVDASRHTSSLWIDSKSVTAVNVPCDATKATQAGRIACDPDPSHPKPAFEFTVTYATLTYTVSGSTLRSSSSGASGAAQLTTPITVPGN